MNYWSQPEIITRTGASHLRRGVVCQDASGCQELSVRRGQLVQILVVADGHGGKRYTQSDVGSHLACKLALKLIADQFIQWSSTNEVEIQRWRSWLVETFPNSLHQRWLASVERHWRQKITEKDALEEPFSPIPYGTTLGVVIMTPTWWAHTGLGDWDLVRVGPGGDVALVNEELDESQTSGEATYSLCLNNAPSHFAVRSAVYPISQETPSFSLLLSTDGVRKSCSTDDDFFAIAKYLCEGDQPRAGEAAKELNSDLDRISSQGSGDDVSVAIGRWFCTDQTKSKRAAPGRDQGPKRRGMIIIQPREVNSDIRLCASDPLSYDLSDESAAETTESKQLGSGRKPLLLIISSFVLASALGIAAFSFLRGGAGNRVGKTGPTFEMSPELKTILQQEVDALCGFDQTSMRSPVTRAEDKPRPNQDASKISNASNLLTGTLDQRKSIFKGLVNQSKSLKRYLDKPSKDPLGALIAWDYSEKNREDESASPIESEIGRCPPLEEALAIQWNKAVVEYRLTADQVRNAMLSIDELYKSLSAKDFEKSRLFYVQKVEDQFKSEFFKQFNSVTAGELRTVFNQRGLLIIEGEIRFNWSDGTKQVEKRLFVVDTSQADPIIIGSEFMKVIEPRQHLNGYG